MRIKNSIVLLLLPFALLAQISDAEIDGRLQTIKSPIELSYNSFVRAHITDYLRNEKESTSRILEIFKRYEHPIDSILKENNLPSELKYMAMSLSGCSNFETSEEGGTGFYMMRYGVAKSRGIHISSYVDERRDVLKATHAFAAEMKDLYKKYKNWHFAMSAYYASDLEFDRAISYSKDTTKNYWKVHSFLPFSYQKTVPKYIAAVYIYNFHIKHRIKITDYFNFETDTVPIREMSTIYQLATKLEIDYELLKTLNPIYKKQIIPNSGRDYFVVLPKDKVAVFYDLGDDVYKVAETEVSTETEVVLLEKQEEAEKPPAPPQPEYTTIYYTVRKGDILLNIADYYDCTVSTLKRWNGLRSDLIAVNQRLKVVVPTSKLDYYRKINGLSAAEKSRIARQD